MANRIEALQAGGFSEDEIAEWAAVRRKALSDGGFADNEIDAYFTGGVVVPTTIPQAFHDRIAAGEEAGKREGGLLQTVPQFADMIMTPEGRGKLWGAVKQYPYEFVKGMVETAAAPGNVAAGRIDLNTDEGLDQALGLGTLIGLGRFSKINKTGKTSGLSVAMGDQIARVERAPTGEVFDQVIGGLPESQHFVDAAKAITVHPIERIESAAIQLKNGEVFTGITHADALENAMQARGAGSVMADVKAEDVFRTSTGRIVDRHEAAQIADAAEQIKRGGVSKEMGLLAEQLEEPAYKEPIGVYPEEQTLRSIQDKLLKLYEEDGLLPAEVAHDAQTDPVILQKLLSKDPRDLPSEGTPVGAGAPPPSGPSPPGAAAAPPPPPPAGSYEAARKAILDKISVGERGDRSMTWSRFYTDMIDDLHPLKAVSEDAYETARLTRGQFGKAGYFLEQGTFDFRTYKDNGKPLREILEPVRDDLDGLRAYLASRRALEIEASEPLLYKGKFTVKQTESMLAGNEQQLSNIKHTISDPAEAVRDPGKVAHLKGQIPSLETEIAAQKDFLAKPPESQRKSGFDLEAAQRVVDEGSKTYAKVAIDLVSYQNRLLSYLRDSGVISKESFDAMIDASNAYVPFYRLMGDTAGGGPGGKGFGPGNPVKRLKGSERDIIDPLESIIKNTYAYISIAERNAAGIKLVDALKEQGLDARRVSAKADAELIQYLKDMGIKDPEVLADFIKEAAPEKGDTIGAFRDGVREEVVVDDPDLVKAFRGLDRENMGMLVKVLSVPAKVLRAGAVLTPDFMARNLIRDFITAFINTGKGVFTPLDTAKGFLGVVRRDADYQNWVKSGGANATFVALDRRYMQESLQKLTADTGLMTRSWNVVTHPFQGLRMLSELFENATRLGEFKALAGATKEEMQSAAFASREVTLDFARMGAKMRGYNMITAFANAQIQGADRVVRAFHDNHWRTLARVGAGITLPSAYLWWANHDDPRYKELPDWQKDLFWIIPTDSWQPISAADAADKPVHLVRQRGDQWEFNNGSIYRIPKPFELGVIFGSGVERALDQLIGNDPEAFKGFTKSVIEAIMPSYIPTAVQPMFEQFANRSTFTDRTLIPAYVEKLLPEYQYTPYTTELSKKLGQMISSFPGMRTAAVEPGNVAGPMARGLTTPILIENYVRAWSGGLGMYMMQGTDALMRKAGVLPDPIKPTDTLADIPFIKAFVVRYPSASAESIQRFHDDYQENKRYFDTWMAKAKEGDLEAMSRIQAAGGSMMFVRLDAINETISEHAKMVRDIYKYPMPAEEKRQLIDTLYYSMIEIAKSGREATRQAKQVLQ